jgi:hypothetical protein
LQGRRRWSIAAGSNCFLDATCRETLRKIEKI